MSWVLSIVGLTLVVRAALIPLFVKQIKSSRNMQLIQPKVKELQKKYGHDRERLAQETMTLYRETGTNPFAACLPLLCSRRSSSRCSGCSTRPRSTTQANGFLSAADTSSLKNAKLFGSMPISDTFLGTSQTDVKVLAALLVVAMTATTFTTQRQLMSKNMPKDAMSGPYAQQQKMLLYVLPVAFAAGGVAFPIGVLVYWTTTNAWTMGQQFYVIRRNPAPGTPAFEAKLQRDRAKGKVTDVREEEALQEAAKPEPPRQRQQPKKQTREQRRRAAGNRGPKPAGDGTTSGADAPDDDTDEEKPA